MTKNEHYALSSFLGMAASALLQRDRLTEQAMANVNGFVAAMLNGVATDVGKYGAEDELTPPAMVAMLDKREREIQAYVAEQEGAEDAL